MTWEGYYSPLVIAFYDIKFTFAKKKKINQVQVTIPTCLSFVECSTFFFLVPRVHCPFFFSIYVLFQWTHSLLEDPCIHLYFSSKKQIRLWILYKSAVGFDFLDVWGRRQGGRVAGWSVHHSMRICVVEVGAWFCSAGPLITLHCMSPIVIVTNFFYYVLCPKMSSSWIWKFRKESVRYEAIKSWLWSKNLCLFNHMLMNDLDLW